MKTTEMIYCPRCAATLETREIDGRERRACAAEGCDYVFWDNPTPVVAAIVEMAGTDEVILVRNKGWPEKWLGLVSGFLERGETPEAAARREVGEELGLTCDETSFLGVYPFFERNELILAYHVMASGAVTMGEELAAHKAIPVARLKPWPFGTGPAVADWLRRRRPTGG